MRTFNETRHDRQSSTFWDWTGSRPDEDEEGVADLRLNLLCSFFSLSLVLSGAIYLISDPEGRSPRFNSQFVITRGRRRRRVGWRRGRNWIIKFPARGQRSHQGELRKVEELSPECDEEEEEDHPHLINRSWGWGEPRILGRRRKVIELANWRLISIWRFDIKREISQDWPLCGGIGDSWADLPKKSSSVTRYKRQLR